MNSDSLTYHVPVLLNESVDGLNIKAGGVYVDVTFGGGGHSKEILSRLPEGAHLFSFDQDADAERNIIADDKFTFVRSNFRYIKNFMRYHEVDGIDGVLADLGVSSHHFDDSERGFSFRFDGKLDMRMNQRAGKTAADIVNTYEEEALADLFYLYGELKNSRKIASAIVKARSTKALRTIEDLLNIVKPTELLKPGGRLSVITYHSLEDRIVKNLMKTGNCEGKEEKDFFGRSSSPYRLINNKVIVPDADEQERNPRSRSAKLRIAEKI